MGESMSTADGATEVRASCGDRVVMLLSWGVVLMGITVRLLGLSRQGYWSDEQFSVDQTSSSLSHLWAQGSVEIHPPLFAIIMWVWEHAGGSLRPRWMRLFSALCGCAAVLVSWFGLRRVGMTRAQRGLCAAGTAASGMAIVYSQDVRSYSLLLLAAVGATAAAMVLATGQDRSRAWWVWCVWCMIASATHLFGAILTVWLGVCLCLLLPGRRRTLALTLLALVPQAIWLGHGAFTPGFAAGTDWIQAPGLQDVSDLASTVFGFGGLHMDPGGFTMRSNIVVSMVGALVVAAVLLWMIRRPPGKGTAASAVHRPDHAALVPAVVRLLALLVVGLPLTVFMGSQLVHLWTLRNMIIVLPAWVWSVCLLVSGLPRTPVLRKGLSVLLLVTFLIGLAGTTLATRRPYKTETGRAMDTLAAIRTHNPHAQLFIGGVGRQWLFSSHLPVTNAEFGRITNPRRISDVGHLAAITPATQPTIYLFRTNWSTSSETVDHKILSMAGPDCRAIPLVRVAMVTCHTH